MATFGYTADLSLFVFLAVFAARAKRAAVVCAADALLSILTLTVTRAYYNSHTKIVLHREVVLDIAYLVL